LPDGVTINYFLQRWCNFTWCL